MKYCTSCGAQIPENMNFCPSCGAQVNNPQPAPEQPTMETNNTQNEYIGQNPQPNLQRPMVQSKNIGVAILLSIITCGIYGIVWYINLVNDVNTVCQDEKSSQSGGTVFLLTLVTCGIYGIIWFYNAGKRMNTAGNKYNMTIGDNSVMYLVLMLFGLGIINYCLVQSDLNKFAQ